MVLQRTWLEHQTGRELGAGLLHRWQKSSPGIACRMWQPSTGYIPLQNVLAVQLFCHVRLFVTLWTAACWASLSFTISLSLLKIRATELVMLSKHLTLCHPLLLLPSIFPIIRVFSSELALCIRWPKYWSFSFSISPSNEYQGWFPLGLTGLISLLSKGLSKVSSSTMSWKHQFSDTLPSLWSSFCIRT